MQFPTTETEVLSLAQEMTNGFANNVATYPDPPSPPATLSANIAGYLSAKNTLTESEAQEKIDRAAKNDKLEVLEQSMKDNLRYAEVTVHYDDGKLNLIGWGGRHESGALQPPGQALTLIAPKEGEGWIRLEWKAPLTGDAVAAYQVERRERPEGLWGTVGLAMVTEQRLDNQERGKEWEYRVRAVNKAGDGPASNTVMAVL
ncbi:MAG: fibronectin type III domain-containing protein [Candidatus Hydrogenedentes bacterium]|nr:fibronectin type III domain-containing protein [Candidatus Hydrogenedentota bacterium]